jgi:DNA-binding GntR family transcriptional regulator
LLSKSKSPVTEFSGQVKPIRVQSAPQAAAQAIREAITIGALEPGQRLIEQKLAASLGIGQPTLREALKELEYEGFVRKIPQKGTYITTFDKKDCRELLEVRMSLEPLVMERAALQLTPEIEKDLSRLVGGMRAAAETFDVPRFSACDAEFHRKIAALAGNRRLAKTLESVLSQLLVYGTLGRRSDSRKELVDGAEQHRRILAGLATGNPSIARAVFVTETLKHWNDNFQLDLQENELSAPALLAEVQPTPVSALRKGALPKGT